MRLDIIPLTLLQFQAFFEALFTSDRVDVGLIRHLLDLCSGLRPTNEAPAWKAQIEKNITRHIIAIQASNI